MLLPVQVGCRLVLLIICMLSWCSESVYASCLDQLDQLDPEREWRIESMTLSGNQHFDDKTLLAELQTTTKPWYVVWKKDPLLDPVAFATDLERLKHYYERHGYYQTQIACEVQPQDGQGVISLDIHIEEQTPVTVGSLTVDVAPHAQTDVTSSDLPEHVPLRTGAIFTEVGYVETEHALRQVFLRHGHSWVEIERQAAVDLNTQQVQVVYRIQPGPQTVFGTTQVEGVQAVDPQLVRREIVYQAGDRFSLADIEETRQNIIDLDLFRSVNIELQQADEKPRQVPIRVRVEEKEPRRIRLGAGYSTEERFIGQAAWQHQNWLGGGRRLSFGVRLSSIRRSIGATFMQPYFLAPDNILRIEALQGQEDENTYLLNYSRLRPRLERHFSPTLSGFVGYRFEFLRFNDVSSSTIQTVGGIRRDGTLSGPTLGIVWDTTEDPLNPTQGGVLSVLANQAGKVWGGDYKFFSLTTEAKRYQQLGWGVVLASRLKIGLLDSFGARSNIPLSERFYSGGDGSVRGYGRRKLGPLNSADDPLGGLSLIEGSIELRRSLWRELAGAIFLDFGQLSLDTYDIPVDDLQFAPGFGVSYATPIGPLRLDIGFPLDPPDDEDPWQVHFSIGQSF